MGAFIFVSSCCDGGGRTALPPGLMLAQELFGILAIVAQAPPEPDAWVRPVALTCHDGVGVVEDLIARHIAGWDAVVQQLDQQACREPAQVRQFVDLGTLLRAPVIRTNRRPNWLDRVLPEFGPRPTEVTDLELRPAENHVVPQCPSEEHAVRDKTVLRLEQLLLGILEGVARNEDLGINCCYDLGACVAQWLEVSLDLLDALIDAVPDDRHVGTGEPLELLLLCEEVLDQDARCDQVVVDAALIVGVRAGQERRVWVAMDVCVVLVPVSPVNGGQVRGEGEVRDSHCSFPFALCCGSPTPEVWGHHVCLSSP